MWMTRKGSSLLFYCGWLPYIQGYFIQLCFGLRVPLGFATPGGNTLLRTQIHGEVMANEAFVVGPGCWSISPIRKPIKVVKNWGARGKYSSPVTSQHRHPNPKLFNASDTLMCVFFLMD